MERKLVTVAVDGSAEFTTLTAATAAQDPAQPLHFVLGAGTYYERPFLELADYIITGAGMGQTVISAGCNVFSDCAYNLYSRIHDRSNCTNSRN